LTISAEDQPLASVQALGPHHDCESFDCGVENLNDWLKRFAAGNQRADFTQTYVVCKGDLVVGYYALAAGSVEPTHAPRRISKGLPRLPVPVILLARFAVDQTEQGAGLGAALLKDALLRVAAAADTIGARALLVDAQDIRAKAFYERYGFEESPVDPLQMFLLMKDLRRSLERE